MQILIMVIVIQFIIICWLAYPRIKQHLEEHRYDG